jgi:beta-phosphoglucomutase-like phosphatase (HAD superfamily)
VTAVRDDVDLVFRRVALRRVRTLLLDADGVLFPSEEPAFAASAEVVNRLAAALGIGRRFDADELRLASAGKNFRSTALELAQSRGVTLEPEELERWVTDEKTAVTRHLATALRPDADVIRALRKLNTRYELAVVSSSALARLDACFEATALSDLLPRAGRLSAEDSLPEPSSKPDPAIYLAAAERLNTTPDQGLAVEDSLSGAAAAVAAGFPTLGNVCFAPPSERRERATELERAGVFAVVSSWKSLQRLLLADPSPVDGESIQRTGPGQSRQA